jgi:hypothetical protein
MYVKLSDTSGQFYDAETDFRIVRKQIKELQRVGSLTRTWLNGGGLIVVEDYKGGDTTIEPKTAGENKMGNVHANPIGRPPKNPVLEVDIEADAKALFESNSEDSLRQMAKDRHLRLTKQMAPYQIAKNIVAYDRKQDGS